MSILDIFCAVVTFVFLPLSFVFLHLSATEIETVTSEEGLVTQSSLVFHHLQHGQDLTPSGIINSFSSFQVSHQKLFQTQLMFHLQEIL